MRCNVERVANGLAPLPLKEFIVYLQRCWNHLRCTWSDNTRKATDKWMVEQFEDEIKEITEEFPDDPFSLDIINFIRLIEKYFCPKGHDHKSDKFDFWEWMRRDYMRKMEVLIHRRMLF